MAASKINYTAEIYEVPSQSFKDIPLDKQIEFKINDWAAEDQNGRIFYGRSAQEATDACFNFNSVRAADFNQGV